MNVICSPEDCTSAYHQALLRAAVDGDLTLMRELIARGVHVDAFGCVDAPNVGRCKGEGMMLPQAECNEEDDETIECAALCVAAWMGKLDMISGLLSSHADPDLVESSGRCAIHWAAIYGHSECVGALLGAGAHVLARDATGKTPLHLAASYGRFAVLQCLLQHIDRAMPQAEFAIGVEAEASGLTPLHLAAAGDHVDCASLLIKAGAALDVKAAAELTPLHIAAGQGVNTRAW